MGILYENRIAPRKKPHLGVFRFERFRGLLQDRNLSQKEIGDRIGVSPKQVSRWATGQSDPELSIIRDLARELGVSIDYLVGLSDAETGHVTLSGDEQAVIDAFRSGDIQRVMSVVGQKIQQALRKRSQSTPD